MRAARSAWVCPGLVRRGELRRSRRERAEQDSPGRAAESQRFPFPGAGSPPPGARCQRPGNSSASAAAELPARGPSAGTGGRRVGRAGGGGVLPAMPPPAGLEPPGCSPRSRCRPPARRRSRALSRHGGGRARARPGGNLGSASGLPEPAPPIPAAGAGIAK